MVTISSIPHFFVEILAFALLLAVSSKLTKLLLEKSPTYLEKTKREFISKIIYNQLIENICIYSLTFICNSSFFENYLSKFIFDLLT